MKRIINKLIEAVIYSIVIHILIALMISERYRPPLYRMAGWGIFGATLIAILELLLGGEGSPVVYPLRKLTALIFALYAICFTGVMAFDGFGELLLRIIGR